MEFGRNLRNLQEAIDQGSISYSPRLACWLCFVNKALLEHSHVHLLTHRQLLFRATRAELSGCKRVGIAGKPKMIYNMVISDGREMA